MIGKILVVLVFLLPGLVYSTQVIPLPDINKPSIIKIGKDKLFIAEEYTVKIISLKTFKTEQVFGRKGEGPGEFRWIISDMIISPNQVFISSDRKGSWFSKDGEFLKERKCNRNTSFIPVGDKYLYSEINSTLYYQKENQAFITFSLYGNGYKKIKDLHRTEYYLELIHSNPEVNKNVRIYFVHHFYGIDYDLNSQRIFITDSRQGFFIQVYDLNGQELYTINNKWEPIKIPKSYNDEKFKKREEFAKEKGFWNLIKNCRYVSDKHFPPILSLKVADGKIYAATYRKINGKTEFLIMDLKGSLLGKNHLPVNTSQELEFLSEKLTNYTINKGKLYQLIENEDEESWELHIFNIDPIK